MKVRPRFKTVLLLSVPLLLIVYVSLPPALEYFMGVEEWQETRYGTYPTRQEPEDNLTRVVWSGTRYKLADVLYLRLSKGELLYESSAIKYEHIPIVVAELAKRHGKARVAIRPDEGETFKDITRIIDACRRTKVGVIYLQVPI
ncbi:MAG: hypothetical protein HZA31_11650 [Opitutae bacterium]|nr:hypothetical protein [Opitutae bacterium]